MRSAAQDKTDQSAERYKEFDGTTIRHAGQGGMANVF
jgi:hypothetical protein